MSVTELRPNELSKLFDECKKGAIQGRITWALVITQIEYRDEQGEDRVSWSRDTVGELAIDPNHLDELQGKLVRLQQKLGQARDEVEGIYMDLSDE